MSPSFDVSSPTKFSAATQVTSYIIPLYLHKSGAGEGRGGAEGPAHKGNYTLPKEEKAMTCEEGGGSTKEYTPFGVVRMWSKFIDTLQCPL